MRRDLLAGLPADDLGHGSSRVFQETFKIVDDLPVLTPSAEAERAAFLAAGGGVGGSFPRDGLLHQLHPPSIAGLVISIAMMRSQVFGRATAYLRIASSVFDFGLFIPTVGLAISLVSVVCLMAFHLLAARRLLQLARTETVYGRPSEQIA